MELLDNDHFVDAVSLTGKRDYSFVLQSVAIGDHLYVARYSEYESDHYAIESNELSIIVLDTAALPVISSLSSIVEDRVSGLMFGALLPPLSKESGLTCVAPPPDTSWPQIHLMDIPRFERVSAVPSSSDESLFSSSRLIFGPDAKSGELGDVVSEALFHENVRDFYFSYDSYDLPTDSKAAVTRAAIFLGAHPEVGIVVAGYGDERGSAEYNIALGESRANAAKSALVNAGVAPVRIRVVSYGKEKQFCAEETEVCWQENRRAQFSLEAPVF